MLKELLSLFLTFAKVGVMTFGGGYAMLPILQREVVEKRGWATENELMDYITRNTRLTTTDGASDLDIEGEITGYNLSPQAVTEDAYASKTRLTITVRVKYTDSKNDANDIDQSFSAYRDFDASQMLTDVQEQLCQEIAKELVELIFNATLGNW